MGEDVYVMHRQGDAVGGFGELQCGCKWNFWVSLKGSQLKSCGEPQPPVVPRHAAQVNSTPSPSSSKRTDMLRLAIKTHVKYREFSLQNSDLQQPDRDLKAFRLTPGSLESGIPHGIF